MSEPIAVLVLRKKRDQIAATIAHYERLTREAEHDLAHVNAALTLFEVTGEAADLSPYVDFDRLLRRGETTKICMDALASEGPLDTRQLALRIIRAKGLSESDKVLAQSIAFRVVQTLRMCARRNKIDCFTTTKGVSARIHNQLSAEPRDSIDLHGRALELVPKAYYPGHAGLLVKGRGIPDGLLAPDAATAQGCSIDVFLLRAVVRMKRRPINRIAIGFVTLAALALPAMAATETVLYSFPNSGTGYPTGTLYLRNGSLYGTGEGDGRAASGQVFKLTNKAGSWKATTLVSFYGTNGSFPDAGLIRDSSGVLYGTTPIGDAYEGGNVFALYKSGGKWIEQTIWAFGGTSGDGRQPQCDLVIDKSGNLYGTTYFGGAHDEGTVFELSNVNGVWTETILYSFTGQNGDGLAPYAGLLMAGSGTFYGTTEYGGNRGGEGTVFKLSRSGGAWKEEVIYSFGGAGGYQPMSNLIRDKNGALYGTTYAGGVSHGFVFVGTVFKLFRSGDQWKEQVLHNFGNKGDGISPIAGLRWSPSGSLYGTTLNGNGNDGTVFELTQSGGVWTETILHQFSGNGDGMSPHGGITLDKDGALYGTTGGGGIYKYGTVWKITP